MDGVTTITLPQHQRARGSVRITAALRAGQSHIADLHQQGCVRACFPHRTGPQLQAVLLNTAGGITDGDILTHHFTAHPGAHMLVSTQAAERLYRARPGATPARLRTDITLADGARLDYLPQETILFEASALHRQLHIHLAPTATYLGVEMLIFGRTASGETLQNIWLNDAVSLHRNGQLLLQDAVRINGDAQAALQGPATAAGCPAAASLLYAAPDAESHLPALRQACAAAPIPAGASLRSGVLVARALAPTGQALRHTIITLLATLRGNTPLPRVWSC